MIFALPIVGKILDGLAASEASAAAAPQKTNAPKNSGAAGAADFAQAVDSLDPAAKTAQHGLPPGGKA
jgi:hypothetical protein